MLDRTPDSKNRICGLSLTDMGIIPRAGISPDGMCMQIFNAAFSAEVGNKTQSFKGVQKGPDTDLFSRKPAIGKGDNTQTLGPDDPGKIRQDF